MFRRNLLAFLCALSMLPVSASFAKSPTIEDGVLLVGTDSSFAPFEFLAEDGLNFTGFDMDLIRAIGKELGYKVVVQNMGFDATVPALRTGIVDAVIAGMTINEKRKKFVDFSDPYYTSGLIIMVPSSDTTTKSIKDLEGKKLIVVKGTTAETYFTDNYPDIELVKFDEYQEAYDALLDGRGDAFSTDNTEVLAWAQQNEGFSVGIESLGDIDTIAPAVQKGNTDLLNAINDEIKSLADEQFFHKDFEETLKPVYGDNINPDDLVVEGGVVDSEEKAEDADAAETEDSDAASDDTKEAETTEEPEETEAADAE